jgi:hypothetical protein
MNFFFLIFYFLDVVVFDIRLRINLIGALWEIDKEFVDGTLGG